MNILVKASGDLATDQRFYNWLSSIAEIADDLLLLIGGGNVITEILERERIPFKFGPGGREILLKKGRHLAQTALEKQKSIVMLWLRNAGIKATVFIPVIEIEGYVCHILVNGDALATAFYPNFDKIFVVTLKGREKFFPKEFTKIEVVHL